MSKVAGIEKYPDLKALMDNELAQLSRDSGCSRDCNGEISILNKYAALVHNRERRKAANRKVPSKRFS